MSDDYDDADLRDLERVLWLVIGFATFGLLCAVATVVWCIVEVLP